MNHVYGLDSSSNGICQYPFTQSNTTKHFEPVGILETLSLDAGNGCMGMSTNLFSWTRYKTDHMLPFGLGTKDIGEHHHDTPSTFSMMPNFKLELILAFATSRYLIGVFLGVHMFSGMTVRFDMDFHQVSLHGS